MAWDSGEFLGHLRGHVCFSLEAPGPRIPKLSCVFSTGLGKGTLQKGTASQHEVTHVFRCSQEEPFDWQSKIAVQTHFT